MEDLGDLGAYTPNPMEDTPFFNSSAGFGDNRAPSGALGWSRSPHVTDCRDCTVGHTVGMSGLWLGGPRYLSVEVS